jgi:hypothetical protein
MEFRQCQACQAPFRPRPQIADQRFCSAPACQRERRRRWQATKRQNDPDYRENQKRVQKAWAERHPTIGGTIDANTRSTPSATAPSSGNARRTRLLPGRLQR